MYGLSLYQTLLGLIFSTYGVIIYIFVPYSMESQDYTTATFWLLMVLLGCIIGASLTVQFLIPYLSQFILKFISLFFFRVHQLKPLLLKNLDSHKKANQKIGLMFIMMITSIIFVVGFASNFEKYVILSLTRYFGSDICVYSLSNSLDSS
jgi:hypothetical protein